MNIYLLAIKNKYIKNLLFQIRNKDTGKDEFRQKLRILGHFFGYEAADFIEYKNAVCLTPMGVEYHGLLQEDKAVLIVSAFEDADYFAAGIGDVFQNVLYGKIRSTRSCEDGDWRASIQEAKLPPHTPAGGSVIIAKSILASGCTAISLIGATLEIAKPRKVILVSAVAHSDACNAIVNQYPYINIIFIVGELDSGLDQNGFVLPGLGDVHNRLDL